MMPELTAASTAANTSVSVPPSEMSCIIISVSGSASPDAAPSAPHTAVMPAMNTASAMPETLRHARFGLSRMRRIAIMVAADFGRCARDFATAAITHEPITLSSMKQPPMIANTTPYATATPAPATRFMLLSMAKPNTRATTNSATRHLPGIAAPWRAVTPNGVMATLRNVSSAETRPVRQRRRRCR